MSIMDLAKLYDLLSFMEHKIIYCLSEFLLVFLSISVSEIKTFKLQAFKIILYFQARLCQANIKVWHQTFIKLLKVCYLFIYVEYSI